MNRHFKRAAQILLPQKMYVTVQSIRSRNYQMRLHKEWGVFQATAEMLDEYGLSVLAGPFRGMRYPKRSLSNHDGIPILFGTYELELHPIIEAVSSNHYDLVVDVGSAEGYYAVGLAIRTKAPVHAFDCEPRERQYLRQMAEANQVEKLVHTGSWCDSRVLSKLVSGRRGLVISDCEGYEFDLFTTECVDALKDSDLIIEAHEFGPDTKLRDGLLSRFENTHDVQMIPFSPEDRGENVPAKWLKFAREFREPGQQWFYFRSKAHL